MYVVHVAVCVVYCVCVCVCVVHSVCVHVAFFWEVDRQLQMAGETSESPVLNGALQLAFPRALSTSQRGLGLSFLRHLRIESKLHCSLSVSLP